MEKMMDGPQRNIAAIEFCLRMARGRDEDVTVDFWGIVFGTTLPYLNRSS
jgi:hypothetical protein